ncbi:MAG: hypothetical protein ACNA8W_12385 [Bradymonadaceae bacterium]
MQSRPRRRGDGKRGGGLLDSLARRFVSPLFIGAFLTTAGVVALLAPLTHLPSTMSRGWWLDAMHLPQTAATVAALVTSALVAGAYLWWQTPRRKAWIGVGLMGLGILIAIGQWLAIHQSSPAGRLSLAVNQSTEYYRVPVAAKSMKVMLPLRMTVTGTVFGDDPQAHVRFASPKKQDEAPSQVLRPGQSLDVGELRFTFIGFTAARQSMRVTLKGSEEDTIEVAGAVGESVRVAIDGPSFEIIDISADYMQALGPAVELHSPDHDSFWLFQRSAEAKQKPDFEHGLELVEVQSVPAPVFSVAPHQPTWPLGTGAVLFIAGMFAFLLFPLRQEEV